MPLPLDTPVLIHRRFDDFDDLSVAARHWDLDLMQLDRGEFEGEVVQAVSGDVLFSEGRFCRTLVQQGAAPSGMRTFVVPAGPDVRFKWRGQDIEPDDLLVFPQSGELYALSNPSFHVYTISLPESLLDRAAELADAPRLFDTLRREKTPCPSSLMNPLRKRLHAISCFAKRRIRLPVDSARLSALQSVIPRLIVRAMGAAPPIANVPSARKRARAIEWAQAYVAQFQDSPLAVRDLCKATGVSERTLQYAFLEHFGVTPKAYIRAVRLAGVRRELKGARPCEVKISDIAGRWGFWHMGQFAADYRKQFGELPSRTLSKSNATR